MIWNGYTPATLTPFIVAIVVIVGILYLIRSRRKTLVVPYLGLWKNVASKHKKWVDYLKRLISFLLWCIIALLIALALMDPRVEENTEASRHIIIVMDTSASMAASYNGDDCNTRFECAIKEAREAIDRMTPADRATIIEAAGNVQAVTPFTDDKTLLQKHLDSLSVRAASDSVSQAIALASQLTKDRKNTEIVLYTDGQFSPDQSERYSTNTIPADTAFIQKTFGTPAENLSIESFNVRRYISNRLAFEAFLSVHNGFNVPVKAKLEIYNLAEDALTLNNQASVISEKELTLASGSSEIRIYNNLMLTAGRMAAKITIIDPKDTEDILPDDNIAFARVPDFARPEILCLTPGNLYLEAALLLNENYRVKIEKPEKYLKDGKLPLAELNAAHDIVILDNSYNDLPPVDSKDAAGRTLYINGRDGEIPFKQTTVKDPVVERANNKHTVARWLSLKNLNVSQSHIFKNIKSDDIVLRSIEGPMIVSQKTDTNRALAIGFSLVESDLIFRVALPVLIINAVDWFMDENNDPVLAFETGKAWHVQVPAGMNTATLMQPNGSTREHIPAYAQMMTIYGDQAGIYRLVDDQNPKRSYEFAANFANASESDLSRVQTDLNNDIHPRPSILEDSPEEAPDALLQLLSHLPSSAQNIWMIALLIAAMLLFGEWLTYHRRWTV